jgi:hypothetical protein
LVSSAVKRSTRAENYDLGIEALLRRGLRPVFNNQEENLPLEVILAPGVNFRENVSPLVHPKG